ncbi:MAG TPA: 2-oxo-4-hydroxy-4-carboxy-5-ureidoimidazoline decarboxylase [Streptosporangiaceae bacterium]|jgi:2-oxo-4-hydroxy-4-carboxy-5-ureidoimidazoline decarboxylase
MTRLTSGTTALAAFNAAPGDVAAADVAACCAARAFVQQIVAGRPYADLGEVGAAVDAAFARLDDDGLAEAVTAHPRIGEPAASGWSRDEQAGALAAADDVSRALAEGNAAYQQRFGQVFLICASGLSADQLLAALRARLANDAAAERRIVAEELRKITQLRIRKLLGA